MHERMAKQTEKKERKPGVKKSGTGALRSVVATAASTDALLELVEKLGLVDLIVTRVKSKIEDVDLDELFDEVTDYLRRNPEVLVVSLGAVTVATGLVVWLNNRREWNGLDRRQSQMGEASASPRVRRAS